MTPRAFLSAVAREMRGDRHHRWTLVLCLAVGVGAVVGVAGFTEGLDRGIRGEARRLLAADLAIGGRVPIGEEVRTDLARRPGVRTADVVETLTVIAKPAAPDPPAGRSLLVELKAVDPGYPFYGELATRPATDDLAGWLGDRGLVVAPEVPERLGLAIGDEVRVGGAAFTLLGVVDEEPDRIAGAFSMGPRAFVSTAGLERADLVRTGSRVEHRLLVAVPEGVEARELSAELRPLLPSDGRLRVETWREAQPGLRQGLDRVGRYLGLAALLSLLLGGVGVAQTMRAWIAGRLDSVAILRCLGVRPREVVALYLFRAAVLGLGASLLGVALGLGLQVLVARLLADILPVESLVFWQPASFLRGILLGTGIAILFSLGPVLATGRVPPIRVLRRDADPLPPSPRIRLAGGLVLAAGMTAAAAWQAQSLRDGLLFTAGVGLLGGLLALLARGLARRAARPPAGLPFRLRYALVTLSRPGASPLGATVGLGLGVLAIVGLLVVERHLSATLDRDLPTNAPTAFLIDVQPDQWDTVREVLEDEGSEEIRSVPVVTARLAAIDDVPIAEIAARHERDGTQDRSPRRNADGSERPPEDRWVFRREQRLTWLEELPEDNTRIAGDAWRDDDVAELSIEREYAEELGVGVGSRVTFDVQGVPVELTVTSVRDVDWSSFGINFYLVAEPGVLDDAPHSRVAAARLPAGGEQRVQDRLATVAPNVTLIRIREVLEKVVAILGRLGTGVRLLGVLTALVGLIVLAAAVGADQVRRGGEIALLKALGMTRPQVIAVLATEHALVGLAAALPGVAAAAALGWAVVTHGFRLEWTWPFGLLAGGVAATAVLAAVSGLLAGRPALRRRPIEVLREE